MKPKDPTELERRKETSRRIKAARLLRQISQAELNRRLHADGLGKGDGGRLERHELPLTRVRRDALCRRLGLPQQWFIATDIDVVVGLRPPREGEITQAFDLLEAALLEGAQGAGQAPAVDEAREDGTDRPAAAPEGDDS